MDELLRLRVGGDRAPRRCTGWSATGSCSPTCPSPTCVLFVPDRDDDRFVVVAQMRPTTGPTAYQDDLVGPSSTPPSGRSSRSRSREGRICRESDPVWVGGAPVREEALPVRVGGRVVAVVARATNLAAARTPSQLEIAYLRSANDLAQMLAEGRWPYPGEPVAGGRPAGR